MSLIVLDTEPTLEPTEEMGWFDQAANNNTDGVIYYNFSVHIITH